ncbi:cation:dicarboxylase symporter family transporter [bacterium]|nr:cation:dicarboxylase symporter family transporter [bacterium]
MLKSSNLTIFIFGALIAGILFGWLCPDFAVKTEPLAKIFLNMVKMIIAPLLFSTLVVGIAGHGDVKSLGKIGLKTLVYFEVVTTLALIIGLAMGNIVKPGEGFGVIANAHDMQAAQHLATINPNNSISDMIIGMFPTSVVKSMADGNLLQIVIFSIFFAVAICAVGKAAKPVMDVLNSTAKIMFKFTEYVMYFAPFGIFGAVSSAIGANGIGILKNYAKVIFCLYTAIAIFICVVLYGVCTFVRVPFWRLMNALKEQILLAFSTTSSEAALPKSMEIMEKFGVPRNIVSFVMPTGYTFNLDGSTLGVAMAVLFSTQLVGINLNLEQQLVMMLALMFASKGIAGVPRVSLIVLAGTLTTFNYPIIGVAILLGIDHILDMGRTTTNLIGNCIATVVIARWEGQFDDEKMHKYLSRGKRRKQLLAYFASKKQEKELQEV